MFCFVYRVQSVAFENCRQTELRWRVQLYCWFTLDRAMYLVRFAGGIERDSYTRIDFACAELHLIHVEKSVKHNRRSRRRGSRIWIYACEARRDIDQPWHSIECIDLTSFSSYFRSASAVRRDPRSLLGHRVRNFRWVGSKRSRADSRWATGVFASSTRYIYQSWCKGTRR